MHEKSYSPRIGLLLLLYGSLEKGEKSPYRICVDRGHDTLTKYKNVAF